ncbi:hypothetical protein ACFXPX_13890 [Kitasatospora sp. NPDC059146]|uniref:hypothetical protein n=1 Tax=Kitasatospora sp. NPDC059146 TaxID=3346741 RepID=UPI0036CD3931
MLRKLATAAAATALAASALAATAPVAAADTATPQPSADRIEVGMLFKGYDKAAAEANGHTIKTSPQGFEYSVKKNATETEDAAAQQLAAARWGIKPAAKPGHDVADDYSDYYNPQCGTVWLSGNAVGNLSVDISTGFTLNPNQRAIFYYWEVGLSDSGGVSHIPFGPSGLLERQSWKGDKHVPGLSPSNGLAWVENTSYATLDDGSVCYPAPNSVIVHYAIF